MVVSVLAISTNDILSTYPLPHSGELSAYFDEHNVNDSFDNDASGDLGASAPAEKSELSKGHISRGDKLNRFVLFCTFISKPLLMVPLVFYRWRGVKLRG